MENDKHWADPIEGPRPHYAVDLDKSGIRLIAACLVVFWIAIGCAALVVWQ